MEIQIEAQEVMINDPEFNAFKKKKLDLLEDQWKLLQSTLDSMHITDGECLINVCGVVKNILEKYKNLPPNDASLDLTSEIYKTSVQIDNLMEAFTPTINTYYYGLYKAEQNRSN